MTQTQIANTARLYYYNENCINKGKIAKIIKESTIENNLKNCQICNHSQQSDFVFICPNKGICQYGNDFPINDCSYVNINLDDLSSELVDYERILSNGRTPFDRIVARNVMTVIKGIMELTAII